MFTVPTLADFKLYYFRDFPIQPIAPAVVDFSKYIQDADLQKALNRADEYINPALFQSQNAFTIGYMLMIAHCLSMDLRASSQGISGRFDWGTSSKGVGSVSMSSAIPQKIVENPTFSWFAMTTYGAEYITMIMPNLCGAVFAMAGSTQA